jgi:hypothetical protein
MGSHTLFVHDCGFVLGKGVWTLIYTINNKHKNQKRRKVMPTNSTTNGKKVTPVTKKPVAPVKDSEKPRSLSNGQLILGLGAVALIILVLAIFLVFNSINAKFERFATSFVIPTSAPVTQPTTAPVVQPAIIPDSAQPINDPVVQPQPVVQSAVDPNAVETIIELRSEENAAVGLKNKSVDPVATLAPGEGLYVSSDPGWFSIAGTKVDTQGKGYMMYVFNNSQEIAQVVFHTGWNGDDQGNGNQRWNIHVVVYQVNEFSGLRDHVLEINKGEDKPVVFGYIFDGTLTPDPDLK